MDDKIIEEVLKCAVLKTEKKTGLIRDKHYEIQEISDSFEQLMKDPDTKDKKSAEKFYKTVTFFLGKLKNGCGWESDPNIETNKEKFLWQNKERTKTLYREQNNKDRILDSGFEPMMDRFEEFIIDNNL